MPIKILVLMAQVGLVEDAQAAWPCAPSRSILWHSSRCLVGRRGSPGLVAVEDWCVPQEPLLSGRNHSITALLWLERTSKIIESNHQPNTSKSTP